MGTLFNVLDDKFGDFGDVDDFNVFSDGLEDFTGVFSVLEEEV